MEYDLFKGDPNHYDYYILATAPNRFVYKQTLEVRDKKAARKFSSIRNAKRYGDRYFQGGFLIIGVKEDEDVHRIIYL
jgi:hypothetical protein